MNAATIRSVRSRSPAMAGESIVCFAKAWQEDPTSNNHDAEMLARSNRVLWLNSIATRSPDLGSGRDLRRLVTKARAAFSRAGSLDTGPSPGSNAGHLHVHTPLVLPFPHSPAATALNARVLDRTLRRLR